jgi:hypothetical protein
MVQMGYVVMMAKMAEMALAVRPETEVMVAMEVIVIMVTGAMVEMAEMLISKIMD